jgi:Mg-chelatase subunit ChlD
LNRFIRYLIPFYLSIIIFGLAPALWAQDAVELTAEPTVEPAPVELTAEPTVEPTTEPAPVEVTAEPTVEPTTELVTEPPISTPPVDSFVDTFENGDAWMLDGWHVIDGVLTAAEPNASATLSGVDWPHLLFSASVRLPPGSALSLILRDHDAITIDSAGRVTLSRGGVLLAEGVSAGDDWRALQVQALGGLITAAVDGVVQFSHAGGSPSGPGVIGFLSGGPAEIDNLSIIRLDAPVEPPPVVVVPTGTPAVEPTSEPPAPPPQDAPPIINGLDAAYDALAGQPLTLAFTVADNDGLVTLTASAGSLTITAPAETAPPFYTHAALEYTPAASGIDTLTITVIDQAGSVASASAQINVTEPPAPPTPPAEPNLYPGLTPRLTYTFDDDFLPDFLLRPGWTVAEGTLRASNTAESADILTEFGDGAIHARLLLDSGVLNLAFRQHDMTAAGYTAAFRASGEVALYRHDTLLASAPAAIAGQWRAVRILAAGGDLSIEIDGQPVLSVTDPDPLPPGEISFTAPDTLAVSESAAPGVVQMDDVEVWVEAPLAPTALPGSPLPAPPGIANIGDRVWLDSNGSGLQDSGEPGIANVRVNIFRSNGIYYGSTITNSSGNYQLAVPSGYSYYLTIDLPDGYILTNPNVSGSAINSDFDPITRRTITTYLSSGQNDYNWDAGLVALSICQENAAIDIMLVLDGSGSISPSNFTLMKNFAAGLVQSFSVGANTARFGVVQFSSTGKGRLETGLSTSQSAILSRIHNMAQLNGDTDIAEGLRLAQNELDRAGRSVQRVPRAIVLLTDGEHNGSPLSELNRQIARAKNAKSLVYGIAVGSYVNMSQIYNIASDPDSRYVFSVSSFAGLVQALRGVATNTCYTPVLPYLPPPVVSPLTNTQTNDSRPTFIWQLIPYASTPYGGFFQIVIDNNSTFTSLEYSATVYGLSARPGFRLPDGRYYCRIRGGNILGFGPWSRVIQIVIDTVPPPAPALNTPADAATTTNTRPAFTWRAAPGARAYDIQISSNSAFTALLYNERGLTRTTFTPPASLRQGTFFWRARAVDAAGNIGPWSSYRAVNINIMTAPADNAAIVTAAPARPTFTWARVPGAAGYQIAVATTPSFGASTFYALPVTGTSHRMPADFPLGYGVYYWRVNLDLGSGFVASPFYRRLIITPPAPPRPTLDTPANAAATNTPRPSLAWNAVAYNYAGIGVYYDVQVDNNSSFSSPERVISTSALRYNIGSNLPDGVYYWRVRAVNTLGFPGAWSAARRFTIDTVPPAQVALNTPFNDAFLSAARPQLKWYAVPDAAMYWVQIDNNSSFSSPEVSVFPVTGTTFTSPVTLPQGRYYWRVLSRDAAGNSALAWSSPRAFSISIAIAPAHGSYIVSPTSSALPTFTWAAVPGAVGYQFALASTPSFGASTFYAVPLTTTSHTLPAVYALAYGSYYWRVNLDLGSGFVASPFYQQITITPPAPPAPPLLTPAAGSILFFNRPTFTWNPPLYTYSAVSYEIQISRDPAFASLVVWATTASGSPNYTPPAPLLYGLYYWRVRATNFVGYPGPWSSARALTLSP